MAEDYRAKPEVARLSPVALRDVWQHEARDFTPWLAAPENMALLSEVLGCNLTLDQTEQAIGPFSADIVCRDGDRWVVVENQVEATDHGHLGQLITYAAGLGAVTIVWIAQRFTEQHRAALAWLNELTPEGVAFFGLELELWRIGDSPPAPKFNVVAKPNAWVRAGQQAKAAATPGAGLFYIEYWEAFCAFAAGRHKVFGRARKSSGGTWIAWSARNCVAYTATISKPQRTLRARISLLGSQGKNYYAQLAALRPELDDQLPGLSWLERPEGVESNIELALSPIDFEDLDDRPRQFEWLLSSLERLNLAFEAKIASLKQSLDESTPRDS